MALYARTKDPGTVQRTTDQVAIPNDPANKDWQDYQKWLAIPGNLPDPLPAPAGKDVALGQLFANDAVMFRALEVLIDVLLAKGTIAATDFSPAIRGLYQARKALRTAAGVP